MFAPCTTVPIAGILCQSLEIGNATANTTSTVYGTVVRFLCISNYKRSPGVSKALMTTQCEATGNWSNNPPPCVPQECSCPPTENGKAICSSEPAYVGATVNATCLPGFYFADNTTFTTAYCQSYEKWSSTLFFQCYPGRCPNPPAVENADYFINGVNFNQSVTYWCRSGHAIRDAVGTDAERATAGSVQTIVCLGNRQWSEIPLNCKKIFCGLLNVSHATPNATTGSFQDVVEYRCNGGFDLDSNAASGDMLVTCTANGNWSSIPPACRRVSCGPPLTHGNARAFCTSNDCESMAVYRCNEGYSWAPIDEADVTIKGLNQSIMCLANATWSELQYACKLVNCSTPPAVLNSVVTFNSTIYGSAAQVICRRGFYFEYALTDTPSAKNITCESNGKWTSVRNCTTAEDS